jgi:hypothetical protein
MVPMKGIHVFWLIVAALVGYQFMFRYDRWTDSAKPGLVFLQDNLTGQVYELKRGERLDPLDWVFGRPDPLSLEDTPLKRKSATDDDGDDATSSTSAPSSTRPADPKANTQQPQVPATAGPPVPPAATPNYQTASGDYNADGDTEQVIQAETARSGVYEISVVSDGREVFFAEGAELLPLASKHHGWEDIGLRPAAGKPVVVYRFNPKTDQYEPVQ